MRLQVESDVGQRGVETPKSVLLDGREIEITDNVDRWHGPDYCCFKVKGAVGSLCILHFDETHAAWDLTMFQSSGMEGVAAQPVPAKRRKPDGR